MLITLLVAAGSFYAGMALMSLFAARSYDKGYEDAAAERLR